MNYRHYLPAVCGEDIDLIMTEIDDKRAAEQHRLDFIARKRAWEQAAGVKR